MSNDTPAAPRGAAGELFLISLLILFLELACIRWFPAHVLFLTFFTNTVLLACFLGMSVGCLAAGHRRNYLTWTPILLLVAVVAGYAFEWRRPQLERHLDVGHQASPQVVFFGTEYNVSQFHNFVIPIEAVCGFFFVLIALAMVGPGQELGRALTRMPNRVAAYTINIAGSIVGIVLFAIFSALQLSPIWWFLPVVLGLDYFLTRRLALRPLAVRWALFAVLGVAALTTGLYMEAGALGQHLWSPYYRIDYLYPPVSTIYVNLIGHQGMSSRDADRGATYAYPLPHLLHRDAQRLAGEQPRPFEDVLIIGAGSGNDVSRALQWGARRVDAVEIDPVIQRIGQRDHPDRPYQDPRVAVHLGDGRNFLRSAPGEQYDLIVYALVDSLVLHSGYSNIRLESYLFTEQAFADVKRCLKPGGVFVCYNYFRQGWIVARIREQLHQAFGAEPLVLTLPYEAEVDAEADLFGSYAVFFAGDTGRLKSVFERRQYWLHTDKAPGPSTPNGFEQTPDRGQHAREWMRIGPAEVKAPDESLRLATDDWPFLYLRRPMLPALSLRGMAIMGGLALGLILFFLPKRRGAGGRWSFDLRMFFLGAGFMLIETKAVVHMALLFGSTWMVNSVVFFAVLVMILAANLFVLWARPQKLWPYYAGLFVALAVNCLVPLDFFLGMPWAAQVTGSCLLVFAPILFAGVIFAVAFGRTAEPDRAFGANIAGAMLGGLAENTSMLLGFQYLVLVALGFYALSALGSVRLPARKEPAAEPAVPVAEGGPAG